MSFSCFSLPSGKILKLTLKKKYCNCPKNERNWLKNAVMCLKDAIEMANSADPDQTAPLGISLIRVCIVCSDLPVLILRIL